MRIHRFWGSSLLLFLLACGSSSSVDGEGGAGAASQGGSGGATSAEGGAAAPSEHDQLWNTFCTCKLAHLSPTWFTRCLSRDADSGWDCLHDSYSEAYLQAFADCGCDEACARAEMLSDPSEAYVVANAACEQACNGSMPEGNCEFYAFRDAALERATRCFEAQPCVDAYSCTVAAQTCPPEPW